MRRSSTQLKLRVTYDAPAVHCRRVLRILPQHRPNQAVLNESIQVWPPPDLQEEKPDRFSNRRLLIVHSRIERTFELQLDCEVELSGNDASSHSTAAPNRDLFLTPTRFANLNHDLRRRARAEAGLSRGTQLAESFCDIVHRHLTYTAEPTPTPMPSTDILESRTGSCQDYAHLMISLCRAAGLPARYVAGYNPTEGLMHAWVEVWVEQSWQAFDPTHGRRPTPGSTVVALGRDFQDTRPITGDYRGGSATTVMFCRTST